MIRRCKVHYSDIFVQWIAHRTFHLAVQLTISIGGTKGIIMWRGE
jgi:hypothetical protein